MYLWQTAVLAWLKSPMERSTSLPVWSPWDTSGPCPGSRSLHSRWATACRPCWAARPTGGGLSFPPDCGSLRGWSAWSSHLGLYLHSEMAGATGHVGETQGGELCDERSRRQFTLADALQPSAHGVHAHSQCGPRQTGHCTPAVTVCQQGTSRMECPQASVATQKVLTQRGSDAKKPQG